MLLPVTTQMQITQLASIFRARHCSHARRHRKRWHHCGGKVYPMTPRANRNDARRGTNWRRCA
eukprot:4520689-Alexandrium_andersonii.AAC.1